MRELSEQQWHAIEQYQALIAEHPTLFSGRAARPIILDKDELAPHAAKTGAMLGLTHGKVRENGVKRIARPLVSRLG